MTARGDQASPPARPRGRLRPLRRRFSLQVQALLVVAGVNATFFTLAGWTFRERLERTNDELVQHLVETLDVVAAGIRWKVDPAARLNVAPILRWGAWSLLDDALLIQNTYHVRDDGEVVPLGIDLNPLGSARRDASFDRQKILRALTRSMETLQPVSVAGGRALPIVVGGEAWAACWVRLQSPVDLTALLRYALFLFVLSTLLLTGATFLLLRRLVLAPVAQLAGGVRRLEAGDFAVRLPEPEGRDEVAELVRGFNAMTGRVRDFNRRLEAEVARATDQARKAEIAAMTQRRLAAMGELAAGIAHEINNPLGGLQNAVRSLEQGGLDEERRRRYLDLLSRGLARIGETVHRLRRFTPREPHVGAVDLGKVLADAVELVRHRAERLGVAIDLELPPGGGELVLQGSSNELGQAVLNLLANSLDALEERGSQDPAGPRVVVRAGVEGRELVVEVRDNGPGVGAEELERVADLFYTTKEVGKGTGLGLALVHRAVAAHHGYVDLDSEAGRGFRVRLHLPREAP